MTATNHTEHYGLSQYTEDDRPTYTGDYNSDMSKIDSAIHAASQAGGMATVNHTADLTGDGTTDSPLGVADTIARTGDIPSLDGYATTESVTQAIASAIADRLTAGDIKAGSGISISTSGNTVTISYVDGGSSGGLAAVAHDNTLTGDGTPGTPLGVAQGLVSLANVDGIDDCNALVNTGAYHCQKTMRNTPYGDANITMTLYAYQMNGDVLQVAYIIYTGWAVSNEIWIRRKTSYEGEFSLWDRVALMSDIPNVSALESRIAALETTVSRLTASNPPSVTGLTAKQYDESYANNSNIIIAGQK